VLKRDIAVGLLAFLLVYALLRILHQVLYTFLQHEPKYVLSCALGVLSTSTEFVTFITVAIAGHQNLQYFTIKCCADVRITFSHTSVHRQNK
jgi:hypothetical protein